jgi:non-ribosomal peptide synthetase component F
MDSSTPELSIQNAVVTSLQQQQSQVRQEVDNLTSWKQQLRDSQLALDLSTDYPRSPDQTRTWPIFSRNSFVNPLGLRTYLVGSSPIRVVLGHVHKVLLEGLAHQDIPFGQVVEVLRLERDLSRNPLYQVMFVVEQDALEARIGQDQHPINFINSAANNCL